MDDFHAPQLKSSLIRLRNHSPSHLALRPRQHWLPRTQESRVLASLEMRRNLCVFHCFIIPFTIIELRFGKSLAQTSLMGIIEICHVFRYLSYLKAFQEWHWTFPLPPKVKSCRDLFNSTFPSGPLCIKWIILPTIHLITPHLPSGSPRGSTCHHFALKLASKQTLTNYMALRKKLNNIFDVDMS